MQNKIGVKEYREGFDVMFEAQKKIVPYDFNRHSRSFIVRDAVIAYNAGGFVELDARDLYRALKEIYQED